MVFIALLRSTGEVLYNISFRLSLSDIFLIIRLVLGFGGKCPRGEVPFLSQDVRRYIIGNFNLHHLVKVVASS